VAKEKPTKMLAVLARCRRTGRWRVASRSTVLAVLGSCRLDMRHSFAEDIGEVLRMKVTVFLGSATFVLPRGAEVRPSGLSLLSASSVDVPDREEETDLPMLDIEWTSILGRIRIVTEAELAVPAEPAVPAAAEPRASETAAVPLAPAGLAEPPVGVGFEDLGAPAGSEPPVGVGFEDLGAGIGFEDLGGPGGSEAAGVGFEDLGPPQEKKEKKEPKQPSGIGFEDLDKARETAAPPGVGFEDL
jgi:hypothetical protein